MGGWVPYDAGGVSYDTYLVSYYTYPSYDTVPGFAILSYLRSIFFSLV